MCLENLNNESIDQNLDAVSSKDWSITDLSIVSEIFNKNTPNIVVEPGEPSKNTQLEDIYAWVDGFKLNKRKKTIRRDFSDAGNS